MPLSDPALPALQTRLAEQSIEGQRQEMVNLGESSRGQLIHSPSWLGNKASESCFC